jgi:hypothetical protein
MKRNLLIFAWAILGLLFLCVPGLAVCPEDPNDSGECDTLYLEIFPGDEHFIPPGPRFARFPIYVTHDVPESNLDSIAAFVIPLRYFSSNDNANAVIDPYYNNTDLYPFPTIDRSIFRHLVVDFETTYNWMMTISEALIGLEWDTRILDVSEGNNFWLGLFPTGSPDQKFPQGSRVLLATITLTLDDTTTICLDSCLWPPVSWLAFARSDAQTYIPRHFLPVCEHIWIYGPPPYFQTCPGNEVHYTNGTGYQSGGFVAFDPDGQVASVTASFTGSGVANVNVVYDPPGVPASSVSGVVTYDVVDCGQAGGAIRLRAEDNQGQSHEDCGFNIVLPNTPPELNLPSSWLALTEYTLVLPVSATDPDGDSVVAVELNALWYEPDSLQPPTNSPSYDGGNPGLFTWAPQEADTGTWVCSFSATDDSGAVATHEFTIQVGMPFCGDCTGDGSISVSDVVCLRSYLFKNGSPPDPLCKGDANCNGVVDAGDMVYLINYFFRYGPAPCFECCP